MIEKQLENKLAALKISGTVSAVSENDFYTIYHVDFEPDITLNKIKARKADLDMFFCAHVDIETSGGRVLLKVEKTKRDIVYINNYLNDVIKGINGYEIPLIIGSTEDGTRLYYDLVKCPHLLIGGSTGSGKSVFMHNTIISTIASCKSGIVLIDVKRVEFSMYEGIPHLMGDICYDSTTAVHTLQSLCDIMDKRYQTLKDNNARNIQEYRQNNGNMQYITVFIDELADLLMSDNRIEKYLVRIAQLGRAAGIHLVVATQRPDYTIISGLIRVNIPSRVCFAVQKSADSRIILDMSGGEHLQGMGDGLFIPIGSKEPIHFQGPYISTSDLEKIIDNARHCND